MSPREICFRDAVEAKTGADASGLDARGGAAGVSPFTFLPGCAPQRGAALPDVPFRRIDWSGAVTKCFKRLILWDQAVPMEE
jgi:hypothetical protein